MITRMEGKELYITMIYVYFTDLMPTSLNHLRIPSDCDVCGPKHR